MAEEAARTGELTPPGEGLKARSCGFRPAWSRIAAAAAVAVLAIIVFSNSLKNDFVWDDNDLIVDNPAVHSFQDTFQFFSNHFWVRSDQPSTRGYYRPLILFSYAADYALWGPNPFGFHLTNLFLHALASGLVCVLIMRLTSSAGAGIVAGALFAVHPVHVESVAFISGRTDVLATVCALLSTVFFLGERDSESMTPGFAISVFFFAFALLAKEVAAVLPALLLIGEMTVEARAGKRNRLIMHAALWLVLALYLFLRFGLLRIAPELKSTLGAKEVLSTMPAVVADYARLLIVPISLCADYAVPVKSSLDRGGIFSILLLALSCGIIGYLIARRHVSGLFAAWLVLGLAPVLQIIPISVLKAERFLYLPSVGYCALVGMLAAWMVTKTNRTARTLTAAAFAAIILLFAFRTVVRAADWKDEFTLYRVTESSAPENFRVQYNLGNAYYRRGDIENAVRHTEIAFRLRPDIPQICYNLGVMYSATGRTDEAKEMYRRAIGSDPSYARAYSNLAAILYFEGRSKQARAAWTKALSIDPTIEEAREGLRLLERDSQLR